MPEHVSCNLCGGHEVKRLDSLGDQFFVDDRMWNIVECRQCGLGYVNPGPTANEIAAYYPAACHNHRGAASTPYEREASYVPGGGGDLLDIGARGDFLAEMTSRGWNVVGIDPSEAENAHNLPIRRQRFPGECELPPASFDVITARAVFEHLHDPEPALEKCADIETVARERGLE
jgi:SAM-dependent methyltransferase